MDSLFWKMGSLKAIVAAKSGQQCEGSDSRSIHLCVCRSSSPPQVKTPAVIGNSAAPSAEEISTESVSPPIKPLPLPSSRATVPTPLKFLWFTRKKHSAATENRGAKPILVLHKNDEPGSLIDPLQNQNDSQCEEEVCNSVDFLSFENSYSRLDANSRVSAAILSDAVMANVSSIKPRKSWISRITDLRALWTIPKPSKNQPVSSEPSDPSSAVVDNRSDTTLLQESLRVDGSCMGCDVDGCSLEVSYNKVLHNKESFSMFLEDVSLPEMKDLAQMSSLCDMAYTIPEIQSGGIWKYPHLKYVTSSLEKKAEAEAKVKDAALSKKVTRSDMDKQDTKGSEGLASSNGGMPSKAKLNVVNDSSSAQQKEEDMECGLYTRVCNATQNSNGLENVLQQGLNELLMSSLEDGPGKEADMPIAPVSGMVVAEETKEAVATGLQSSNACPSEWFICDDPSMHTRYFAIQGSESLASWQTNLFFEPTKFEGLDVLVHRGIYEAANALYEQVLPEVLAHFSSHRDLARVCLTGHSLGGSLATLLALMFQIRGVLPRKAILPVITFGSPCIMCGGDHLLRQMNLPPSHIQSIIMHRDVVPRAFSCDYPDHVAQVLKRLNGKFRDHPCLNNQKLLYAPMGQLFILQPNEDVAPSHPLLPCGPGLYLLRHPSPDNDSTDNVVELRAAQRAFLNMPHPLEILSVPGAYGLNGAVSRDHDPRSYMKAIHMVLKHENTRVQSVPREHKRQLMWLLLTSTTRRRLNPGLFVDHTTSMNGALTPVVCKTSMFVKQLVNYGTTSRIGSALGRISMWEFQKGAFSRYTRLISSKHVHLGMLIVLSLRMVILECLSTLFVWI